MTRARKPFRYKILAYAGFFLLCCPARAAAQAELAPWGNLLGIRVDGQLMNFESSLRVVKDNWREISSTGKERQRPGYKHENGVQTVTTSIGQLAFTEEVKEVKKGVAAVKVQVLAKEDADIEGVYFSITLPASYGEGSVQADHGAIKPLRGSITALAEKPVGTVSFTSPRQQVVLHLAAPATLILKNEKGRDGDHLQLYIPLHEGKLGKGATAEGSLTITASGAVDNAPVSLRIDTAQTGRLFEGLGGNFRLQNDRMDPQVIDYCLDNLRVAWGRVEMPWNFWQPQKGDHPVDSARSGKLHPRVRKAMEMAQRLSRKGIPVILSAWFPPAWAVEGTLHTSPEHDGVWGDPLSTANMPEIYQSITGYISYLKEAYGVEVSLFSFNESDLGINVRQTGEEHAALIKGLGAYMAQHGLKTKMLLGDNSDANSIDFIRPAMEDSATHPYIGAISFHSWRGWEKPLLEKWAAAASRLKRPLIVGEGSIDAQAWGYPAIFEEPRYAREEINLYVRLLNICQPLAILQWQLTSDYSPLAGGGIFGNHAPLHPTQRFWNLKQLGDTPEGLKAMAASADKADISIAALGNNKTHTYAIHMVNNGPSRKAVIKGLPGEVSKLRVFVTDSKRNMEELAPIPVRDGTASFLLTYGAYITLRSR